jgi:muconate cycloisomerase
LEASAINLPLRRVVRHASHERTSTENVVVRCELSDGSIGWGEGVPREYVTGESVDSALELLRDADLAGQLTPCPDFLAAVRLAEQLALPAVPGDDRGCRGNAARCALELAVLDAFGRSFGESLTNVTELVAADVYRFRENVQYSGAITSSRGWKLRALALGYRLTGFAQVKVKVGIPGYDDRRRLRTIRRCVGRRMGLRIDANEAWPPGESAERIRELEPAGLDCVEQPVAHEHVEALAAIRRQVATPVMLDESLCSQVDAERAVRGGWCDQFNLRLSKCGGYLPTLRLARYAAAHGVTCQLGCQVGESVILTAAGRHFAASVAGLTAVEGSFDRHLLRETLAFRDLTFGRGGRAPALGGCGHGAWVDGDAVDRLARRREVLLA